MKDKLVLTATETAEVLNIGLSSVYYLRDHNILPQLHDLPGVRFRAKDVYALAGEGSNAQEYTPFRFKELEAELKNKNARIQQLETILKGTTSRMLEALKKGGL